MMAAFLADSISCIVFAISGNIISNGDNAMAKFGMAMGMFANLLGNIGNLMANIFIRLGMFANLMGNILIQLSRFDNMLGNFDNMLGNIFIQLSKFPNLLGKFANMLGNFPNMLGKRCGKCEFARHIIVGAHHCWAIAVNLFFYPIKTEVIMTQTSFIPTGDADFNLWQSGLITIVQANATTWGILPADITSIVSQQTIWVTAFAKASNKQNRTAADVQGKGDARNAFETNLRKFIAQWLSNNTRVPNSERQRMGITVKSGSRTAAPVPSSSPVAIIDFSNRLQHTINFTDETTQRSKAKPDGVHGCEVWAMVGTQAPKDASEFTYLATDTATPYVATFDGEDTGKTVWYMLRWVNTRGERGPWSSTFSAIVN